VGGATPGDLWREPDRGWKTAWASALQCAGEPVCDGLVPRGVCRSAASGAVLVSCTCRVPPPDALGFVTLVALFLLTRLETRTKESNLYASNKVYI